MNPERTTRIAVLGAGRVGSLIASDLAAEPSFQVTAVDRSDAALEALRGRPRLRAQVRNLAEAGTLARTVGEADLVVCAVPGSMGHAMLERALEAGKPVVDISFSPEDPLELDDLARRRGVSAVVDCGVAPGLSNWLVGRAAEELDEVISAEILVGGLPVTRVWPYEYRAVFSPTDVIEEYTRPCRLRENGEEVTVPALSSVELVDLPGVGTLEAFNTDGLRTLLKTIPTRSLKEKTLRYPGHAERVRMLRETGFFDEDPVEAGGVTVSPRAITEKLLFKAWALPKGEEDITVMRITVNGRLGDERARLTWHLYDRTDLVSGETSMARTTGFPCAIVTRLLADGSWSRPGVHPPEHLGRDAGLTDRLLRELERRGVRLTHTRETEPLSR